MSFGWGIVSTGKHPDVKIAPAMAAAGGGELVGVYSRDQQRAEAFAQKHGARAAYSRLGDLLKDSLVEGVFVSSPNALHAEHVVQAVLDDDEPGRSLRMPAGVVALEQRISEEEGHDLAS